MAINFNSDLRAFSTTPSGFEQTVTVVVISDIEYCIKCLSDYTSLSTGKIVLNYGNTIRLKGGGGIVGQ